MLQQYPPALGTRLTFPKAVVPMTVIGYHTTASIFACCAYVSPWDAAVHPYWLTSRELHTCTVVGMAPLSQFLALLQVPEIV